MHPSQSSGKDSPEMDNRQDLLEGSLAQVFAVYGDGLEMGLPQPVVVLLDCEDEIGGPLARQLVGDADIDEARREVQADAGERITTTLALPFSWEECRDEVAAWFPYLAATFEQTAPRDGFITVVVTAGGAATFTVPLDAKPTKRRRKK